MAGIIKREFKVNYILLAENKLFRDGSGPEE